MNRKNQIGTAMRSALLTCAVAAAASLAAPVAMAFYVGNTTGGAACKAANGPGASQFYFSNLSAQNVSASLQYLSCAYIDTNRAAAPFTADASNIQIINTTAAAVSFTCVIQAGVEGFGTVNSAVVTQSQAANSAGFMFVDGTTTPAMPARADQFRPYTLSCSVPSQGKIGLVNMFFPGTIGA